MIERSVPGVMYNYGSEAREIEYTEGFEGSVITADKKAKAEAARQVRIEKLKRQALKSLAVIAMLLAVAMAREAQIDKLCGEIARKEDSIHNINAIITQKEMQLSGHTDMNIIEKAAEERLGMQKPVSDQYMVIALNKHDGGEVLTEDTTNAGGMAAFFNKAKILLEYLY